jgi:hypothetical protein
MKAPGIVEFPGYAQVLTMEKGANFLGPPRGGYQEFLMIPAVMAKRVRPAMS